VQVIESDTESRIATLTEGLNNELRIKLQHLLKHSKENALNLFDYLQSFKNEVNPSLSYQVIVIRVLVGISKFHSHKLYKEMTQVDILLYLNSLRKNETTDPLHKWIGTYNMYKMYLTRFFKWLYYPQLLPNERQKPECVKNILSLKRKEKSIYKPTDLWTTDDDTLFLKFCPSKRDRCYHAMSRDLSCRPHELLKLRIKDVVFKTARDKQYAEVLVNGKTGQRTLPLINCIPYLKDWLDDHPQAGNFNSILICGFGKCFGRKMQTQSIASTYRYYKNNFFPKLINNPSVLPADKIKIKELLKKPWNPYIRRHSALTEKSKILKEHVLRQHAGWTPNSIMHQRYLHYFGNESSESLLEAYGIIVNNTEINDKLKPKQCPNCNEPNKIDSKFCAKCRMVVSYDSYLETINERQAKDNELIDMKIQLVSMQKQLDSLFIGLADMKDQEQINKTAKLLYEVGILKKS